jgi:hypothetical protein
MTVSKSGRLIATFLVVAFAFPQFAAAANENETTFHNEYIPQGFPAVRENPHEMRSEISVKDCNAYAKTGSFTLYIFESDALRKFDRFGNQGLDADDSEVDFSPRQSEGRMPSPTQSIGRGIILGQGEAVVTRASKVNRLR